MSKIKKELIRMILASSGDSYRSVAPAFNLDPSSAASKLGRGISRADTLVKLLDHCQGRITLELKDGTTRPLTIKDFE